MLVVLFAEPVARETTEEVSTELLGTQVDVGRLDLLPRQASVDLGALAGGRPVRAAPQPGRGRPHRAQAQSRGAGREEARGRALRAAGHALRHRPQDAGAPGDGRRLRAPGAQGRARLGPAVRRAAPAAHADRHDQAAGAQPGAARHGAGGAGPARADRLDPPGARRRASRRSTCAARSTPPARSPTGCRRPIPAQLGLDGTRQAIQSVQQTLKQLEAGQAAGRRRSGGT